MGKKRISAFSIVLWCLLAALAALLITLLPRTLASYDALRTERAATPTPTAIISSMLAVTPDPNVSIAPTAMLLKTGSAGEEVRLLQQRLFALEYYTGEIDGKFGPGTAEAVRRFQAQHGLTEDGVAGDVTRAALQSDSAQKFVPTPTPEPTPSPTPAMLSRGDKGDAVRALQKRLKELGYYASAIDGDFGAGTLEAVRAFQAQHGLSVDGIAAVKTMTALYSGEAQSFAPTPTPDPNAAPMLVNKANPVPESYRPGDLVLLKDALPASLVTVKGSEIEGDRLAVKALGELLKAAHAGGIRVWQVSAGYRSYAYQKRLFDAQVEAYIEEGKSRSSAVSQTRLTVAEPGASEHHTGLAFDITVPGTIFKGTKQQLWLEKNCWDYGFVMRYQEDKEKITGIIAECWHIRYVGLPHSKVMRDKNLCLEEYVDFLRR